MVCSRVTISHAVKSRGSVPSISSRFPDHTFSSPSWTSFPSLPPGNRSSAGTRLERQLGQPQSPAVPPSGRFLQLPPERQRPVSVKPTRLNISSWASSPTETAQRREGGHLHRPSHRSQHTGSTAWRPALVSMITPGNRTPGRGGHERYRLQKQLHPCNSQHPDELRASGSPGHTRSSRFGSPECSPTRIDAAAGGGLTDFSC